MMKKIFSICSYMVVMLAFASCNLFIDEEPDEYGFTDVPVHTGEGYDTPVTTTQNGCEVTYQFKRDVRQLTLDDTQHYITYVEQDASGLFIEIHFSGNTPEDRLPALGEILVCNDLQTFPMGCMHRVQMREIRNGEYCYIAALADLEETFAELDINGALSQEESEELFFDPDLYSVEEAKSRATRFDHGGNWNTFGGMKFKFSNDTIGLGYNFNTEPLLNFKDPNDHTDVKLYFKEGSNYTVIHKINFDDFSISRGSYKIHYEKTEDINLIFQLEGSYNGNVKIKHFRPVKGTAVTIGPVVFVLFVNLNFDMELTAYAKCEFKRHAVTRTINDFDLRNPFVEKKRNEVVEDTGWQCESMFGGTIGLRASLELGLGIYGKVLSVRIIPSVYFGIDAAIAKADRYVDGVPIYTMEDKPGITPKLNWQIELGVYFDLSFMDFFKNLFSKITKKNVSSALDKVTKEAKDNSDWYKQVDNIDAWFDNENMQKARNHDTDKDRGISVTFGPWDIKKFKTIPWFPSIKDNSFVIRSFYNKDDDKLYVFGEYEIESVGFFGKLNNYAPGLVIKRGKEIVDRLWPAGEGKSARVEAGKTYQFDIPSYEDDVTYIAQPAYYCLPSILYQPDVIDKGLPFCSTTPAVAIENIRAKGGTLSVCYDFADVDRDGNNYEWTYHWDFDVYTSIKGAEYIYSWGVQEARFGLEYKYKKKDNDIERLRDGEYLFHCSLELNSHYYVENREIEITVYPWCVTKDDITGINAKSGDIIGLWMRLDGSYDFTSNDPTKARGGTTPQPAGDGKARLKVNSIEYIP